jgi:hypothetical protein
LTRAVKQGSFGERAAFGSFVYEAGRVFLVEERPALLFALRGNKVITYRHCVNGNYQDTKMPPLDFKGATDILTQGPGITLARIAEHFGVQLATIARARIDTDNRRPAPANWRSVIAEMAEAHARELEDRSRELRQLADELRTNE